MRKLVIFMHLSLDGFCAKSDGSLDWISYDEEMQKWADEVVASVGNPLYGRGTYKLMQSYWPNVINDQEASKHDVAHAKWLNDVDKYVVTGSTMVADWAHTHILSGDIESLVGGLKNGEGKDIVIFGSPGLVRSLMGTSLIDEYKFSVSPVILGSGKSGFHVNSLNVNLRLLDSRALKSGALVLHYGRR